MNYQALPRSQSLHNIPQRKLDEAIQALIMDCKACSGKSNLDGLCQKCSVNIIARNRWYDANIPLDFWAREIKDFVGPEPLKKAYDYFSSNVEKMYSNGVSVCVCGSHGIGKSFS